MGEITVTAAAAGDKVYSMRMIVEEDKIRNKIKFSNGSPASGRLHNLQY